jgi:CspA family cold shock protein
MMSDDELDRPAGTSQDVTAVVKWFNPAKGFGFVQPDDGSVDAFLHLSVVESFGQQSLPQGAIIVCGITQGEKGPQVAQINSIQSLPEASLTPGSDGQGGPGSTVEGMVKFFNPEKGFGFVIPDEGGKDVFVSARMLERLGLSHLEPNQRVRMTVRMGQKGPTAESLEFV